MVVIVVVVVVCCKGLKIWLLWCLLWFVWGRNEEWVVVENGRNRGRRLGLWGKEIGTSEGGGSGINGSVDGGNRRVN